MRNERDSLIDIGDDAYSDRIESLDRRSNRAWVVGTFIGGEFGLICLVIHEIKKAARKRSGHAASFPDKLRLSLDYDPLRNAMVLTKEILIFA